MGLISHTRAHPCSHRPSPRSEPKVHWFFASFPYISSPQSTQKSRERRITPRWWITFSTGRKFLPTSPAQFSRWPVLLGQYICNLSHTQKRTGNLIHCSPFCEQLHFGAFFEPHSAGDHLHQRCEHRSAGQRRLWHAAHLLHALVWVLSRVREILIFNIKKMSFLGYFKILIW